MFTSVQGVLSLLLAVQGKYWCLWPLQFPICGWELSRGRFPSLLPRGSVEGGGLLGDASWKYSCFIQLFGLMGFVCWTLPLTRLQPGLAVHSLFAGQVVGSTAVFVMCGLGWRGEKVPQCTVQIQSEGRRARSAVQTSHNSTFANTCCTILLSGLLWPSAELSQWLVLCCLATGIASIQLSVVVIRVFLLYGSKLCLWYW